MNILLIDNDEQAVQEFTEWLKDRYPEFSLTTLSQLDVYMITGGKTANSAELLPELFLYGKGFDFVMSRVTVPVFLHETKETFEDSVGIGLLAFYEADNSNKKIALLANTRKHPTDAVWGPVGDLLHSHLTLNHPDTHQEAPKDWTEVFLSSFLHLNAA